jgi:rubrerythrin
MKFKEFILNEMLSNEMNLNDKTDDEILRMAIVAEQDAIVLYQLMSRKVKNKKVKEVLLDVAREEKVHIGEFKGLLEMLDKEDVPTEEEGKDEIEDM